MRPYFRHHRAYLGALCRLLPSGFTAIAPNDQPTFILWLFVLIVGVETRLAPSKKLNGIGQAKAYLPGVVILAVADFT
jgi:hypothetical protein